MQLDKVYKYLISVTFVLLSVAGCQKKAGDFKQDCYPNATCNDGLACVGGVCVREDDGPKQGATRSEQPLVAEDESLQKTPKAIQEMADNLVQLYKSAQTPEHDVQAAIQEAQSAYVAMIRAWNHRDAAGYFNGFSSTLECYYNEAFYDRERFMKSSRGKHFQGEDDTVLTVDSLEVLKQSPTRIVFKDTGSYTTSGETKSHEKIITLKRIGDVWLVVGEVSRSAHKCYDGIFPGSTSSPSKATKGKTCPDVFACIDRCMEMDQSMENEDAVTACLDVCNDKMPKDAPKPFHDCYPTVDAKTNPCGAFVECKQSCGTSCPRTGCNFEMDCIADCEDFFEKHCPFTMP